MTDPATDRAAITLFEQLLDVPESDRESWIASRTEGNAPLRSRLNKLIEGDRLAALSTGGAVDEIAPEPLPERIGAYRIVGLIGRGGMGSVYRGERDSGDFDHVVAIKVIKAGLLGDALSQRFRNERQTLANLSHPNIAQLLDGGETADGAPYIVMELVDGLSLRDWVDAHAPDRTERLRIFTTICRAVGFAHRNLVVHRDITPSNVLVTRDGTVKLIDFGIAKAPDPRRDGHEQGIGAGSIGSLSLTPGYAAPERMASSIVTTAADIYSLGKLLAWLFAEPDRELRAIISRATADDPAARYPTADALADDVEAWASGKPVSAVGDGRHYVAGKFIRRHRVPLAVAAGTLAILIGSLATAVIANHQAQLARVEAERRFGETRAIANTMMFDAYDQVSAMPGSTLARITLARASLKYLDTLSTMPNAPFAVRVETGRGYARLAQVIGSGAVATMGKLGDADKMETKGLSILEQAFLENPGDRETRRALAGLLVNRSGSLLFNVNDTKAAFEASERALQLITPLGDGDAETARIHLNAITGKGEALSWDLDWAGAEKEYRAANAYYRALPVAIRSAPTVRRRYGTNLKLLGEALNGQGRAEETQQALDKAVSVQEALLADSPRDPGLMLSVVAANRYRAIVLREIHRGPAALRSITRAVEVAEQLRSADPEDASAAHIWLLAIEPQAQMFADANMRDATFGAHAKMDREYRRLISIAGDVVGVRRSYAAALKTMGGNLYNLGAYGQACATWRNAKAQWAWVASHGGPTETDRSETNYIAHYLSTSCENGPPRAGLGDES